MLALVMLEIREIAYAAANDMIDVCMYVMQIVDVCMYVIQIFVIRD